MDLTQENNKIVWAITFVPFILLKVPPNYMENSYASTYTAAYSGDSRMVETPNQTPALNKKSEPYQGHLSTPIRYIIWKKKHFWRLQKNQKIHIQYLICNKF